MPITRIDTRSDIRRSAIEPARMALDFTLVKVRNAIDRLQRGLPLPEEVVSALRRFFRTTDPSFLHVLLRRIELVQRIIEQVPILYAVQPINLKNCTGISCNISNIVVSCRTVKLLNDISTHPEITPAMAVPNEHFIAVFPRFILESNSESNSNINLQPTRLIHETFHYCYPFIRHDDNEVCRTNAFSYQGFVSFLGGIDFNHDFVHSGIYHHGVDSSRSRSAR